MGAHAEQIRDRANDGFDNWRFGVSLDYCSGYHLAYDGFTNTMKEQAEADKARAEMFITIASVISGSLLMATVGETSLRVVAGNALLDFVCERNLDRTFSAMAVAAENKTFMFALGGTLDAVKDEAKKRIKDAVTDLVKSQEVKTSNPAVKQNDMEKFLIGQKQATIQTAARVEMDGKLSETQKSNVFHKLLASPMCNPPKSGINAQMIAKKMELCIYMRKILESGELLIWAPYYGGNSRHPASSKPITQLPSDPNYPKNIYGPMGSGQTVGYTELGATVQHRINELHKDVFGGEEFFPEHWFLGSFFRDEGKEKRAAVKKAEETMDKLAFLVRPLSVFGLKS